MNRHVALLIGRKGSVGFPGKNTTKVLGRAMMEYPLLAAAAAPSISKVYVSTDDDEIRAVAERYGAEFIQRPPELATKQALGEDAFAHGYRVIRDRLAASGDSVATVTLLFCNAPTITAALLEEGIAALVNDESLDSAVTVSCYNMWSPLRARRIGQDGLLHPFVPLESFGDLTVFSCDRDSQGDVWFADMSVSIVRPRCLEDLSWGILPQRWMGRKIYPVKSEAGLDVDFGWQMPGVEYWLRNHGFTETSTPYDGK